MELWLFWAVIALIVLALMATLWRAISRAAPLADAPSVDVAVYRDQLADIDRDVARGTIPAEEGQRMHVEVSRRLLDADRAQKAAIQVKSGGQAPLWAMGLVVIALVGAVAGYIRLGAPGYPDLPLKQRLAMADQARATRPSQAEAEAKASQPPPQQGVNPEFVELMTKLRIAVKEHPDDQRGLELLARNEAALGNITAARAAQAQLIALKGDAVTAGDYAALAELMVMATGGFVSPEAEEQLGRALQLDPKDGTARYYSGLMFAQVGRFDRAFVVWNALLEDSAPDAPWLAALRTDLPEVASRAGINNFALPPEKAAPGPSVADITAAQDMTGAQRQAMIEGMVAQLGARLASEGGSAEEWSRLISSLGVLGRTEDARQIYAEAQERFKGQSVELQGLREAAASAGVAE